MKTIICVILLLFSAGAVHSQQNNARQNNSQNKNVPFIKRIGLKGSVEISKHSLTANETINTGNKTWMLNFGGAVSYDYNSNITIEAEYKYIGEHYYSEDMSALLTGGGGEKYFYYGASGFSSHIINLKADIFMSKDRKTNPVYFIGGVSFSSQPVSNTQNYYYWDDYGNPLNHVAVESQYFRQTLGPMAGVGVYFDFGIIDMATEFSFASRVALGKDKGQTESAFSLNFSPILKF